MLRRRNWSSSSIESKYADANPSLRRHEKKECAISWGAFGQLRATPRFFGYMLALVPASLLIGMREIARLEYGLSTTGNVSGVGVIAGSFSIAVAVTSVFGGRAADRFRPRSILVTGLALTAVISSLIALLIATDRMTIVTLVMLSAAEGVAAAFLLPAVIKGQAAIVAADAKGSAEIVNLLRLGLGTLLGVVIAGWLDDPVLTMVVGAVFTVVAAIAMWLIASDARPAHASASNHSFRRVVADIAANPALRTAVVIDLVIALTLPTQLTSVVLTERDRLALSGVAFAAGLSGVVAGQLLLAVTGLREAVRRNLTIAYSIFLALALIGVFGLAEGWAMRNTTVMVAMLFIGSASSAYALATTGGLIQQHVPDEIRGTLAGLMNTGRFILIALGAWLLTTVALLSDARYVMGFLALELAVVLVATRAFAGITLRREPAPLPASSPLHR